MRACEHKFRWGFEKKSAESGVMQASVKSSQKGIASDSTNNERYQSQLTSDQGILCLPSSLAKLRLTSGSARCSLYLFELFLTDASVTHDSANFSNCRANLRVDPSVRTWKPLVDSRTLAFLRRVQTHSSLERIQVVLLSG